MEVRKTRLDDLWLIKPPTVFDDFHGAYMEILNEKLFAEADVTVYFVQDDISVSSRHVLYGVHGDGETWMLLCCLYGKFYLIVVNCDEISPQYHQWESFVLSERNRLQVPLPPKLDNGHLVLSQQAFFDYRQSTYYNLAGQVTLFWNDPELKLWWPRSKIAWSGAAFLLLMSLTILTRLGKPWLLWRYSACAMCP